jgi:DNA-binding helix-hairpin-helix protein with protein kinase domain
VPVFDGSGQPVGLSQPIGSGGEGVVFAVDGAPDVVAKLYHAPAAPAQAAKLAAMVAIESERLRRVAAWPLGTLHERPGGAVRGLLMPRLALRAPIHQLYGPRSRLAEFPRADWRFLVRTAGNLARAFAVVHAHGQVVGDVNQGNVLVAQDATVGLIDCDSFQIEKDGQRFPCEVGVSTFQPPELQGLASFRGVVRTRDHDNFGLAVLLFHLLMLGRHPFAGAYGGGEEMPVERAIRELRFAYGRRAGERGMRPPPLAPTLEVVSGPVAELFERAFAPEAARHGRPSAESWAGALDALWHEVVTCPDNPGHRQHFRLGSCPWCAIERRAGTVLFPAPAPPPSGPAFDLAAAWAAIEAVPDPGPAPALPPIATARLRAPAPLGRAALGERRRGGLTAGLALAGMAGAALAGPPAQPGAPGLASLVLGASLAGWVWSEPWRRRRAAATTRRRARDEWARAVARWNREAGDETFRRKRRRLDETKAEYHDLAASHRRRLQELESGRQERQRQRFLERHDLASAALKGVGPGREAMLASYGIATAADVTADALAGVPGFGAGLTRQLLDWRRGLERGFAFDPARGIDRSELLAVEAAIQADRRRLEQTLRHGAADLRALADAAERARKTLRPTVDHAFAALALAEADCAAGPKTSRDRKRRPAPSAA